MKERLQKGAIDTAQTLINLCKSMKDCSECPFAYWNDRYDKGIAHCTIGSPSDSWDINLASVKTESTEQSKPKEVEPFNFSFKEDRDALLGKRICNKDYDIVVAGFKSVSFGEKTPWVEACTRCEGEQLLEEGFIFADTGMPVGKEVEE